jgi:hypothetical protein
MSVIATMKSNSFRSRCTCYPHLKIQIIEKPFLIESPESSKGLEIDQSRVGFGKDVELALDIGIAHINIVGELLDGGIGYYVEATFDPDTATSFDRNCHWYSYLFPPSEFRIWGKTLVNLLSSLNFSCSQLKKPGKHLM